MPDRSHLSIGEVLSLVQEDFPDVTISKIRFLESQGLLDPERTPSGYRKFYDRDIERLQWILTQQRDHFLPLKVIRDRLDEWDATGNPPAPTDDQTPDADHLPVGHVSEPEADDALGSVHEPVVDASPDLASPDLASPEPEVEDADTRHAAASFAATSAVEVLGDPQADEPARVEDAAMEAAPRTEPAEPPADEPTAGTAPEGAAEDRPGGEFRVGPTSTSLTADELAQRAGIPVSAVAELESYSMIESKRIGPESYFEPAAIPIAEACRRFLDHGIEVRHLRMYKIAAEREAGMFEQLVMPLLKQRNPEARARAVATVTALADVGEALHAALLRSALSDTLP